MTVSDYEISHAFPGLLCMWLTFLIFNWGFNSYKKTTKAPLVNIVKQEGKPYPFSKIMIWPARRYVIAAIATWICSIMSERYYTGKGVTAVIKGAFGGASAYNDYQRYFSENNLGTFSLSKIPYI